MQLDDSKEFYNAVRFGDSDKASALLKVPGVNINYQGAVSVDGALSTIFVNDSFNGFVFTYRAAALHFIWLCRKGTISLSDIF